MVWSHTFFNGLPVFKVVYTGSILDLGYCCFVCFRGSCSNSVQVGLNGIDAEMVLTLTVVK